MITENNIVSKDDLLNHYVSILLPKNKLEINEVQNRITENIEIGKREKNNMESNLILTCLKNHFIFYNLSEGEMYFIINQEKMLKIGCTLPKSKKMKSSIASKTMEHASLLFRKVIWSWLARINRKRRY
jgi:hypothetical protein